MKRDEAIHALRTARRDLQDALGDLTEEDYTRPKSVGTWTLQDAVAHIAAWDEEMVRVLQTFPMPGESMYTYSISDRNDFAGWNEEQAALRRAKSPAQVLMEFENARRDLIQVVEGLTDAVLNRSRMTSWGKPAAGFDLLLWQAERDSEYAELVRRYRKKRERWQRARKNRTVKRKLKTKK